MLTSRRRFLLASSLTTLGVSGALVLSNRAKFDGFVNASELETLSSIIDTIIPSSIITADQKGALDLEIDNAIQKIADRKPKFQKLLERLVLSIENTALVDYKRRFAKLDIDKREALLTKLLTQIKQRQLRSDLQTLRNSVMNIYYTSAHGHSHLGYTLPSNYPNY